MEKKIFEEIKEHLLKDEKPSIYLNSIKNKLVGTPLEILAQLETVEQEKKYHPEGNVWNHVMLVTDKAAELREYSNDPESLMMAALLHDTGKKIATRKNKSGRLISYDHDKIGAKIVNEILNCYDINNKKNKKIINLVKYHMHHLYIIKNLPFASTTEMINSVNMRNMILLFISDRLGRGQNTKEKILQELFDVKEIVNILQRKNKIDLQEEEKILDKLIKEEE